MKEQETAEVRGYQEKIVAETKKRTGRKCPRCRSIMNFDPKEGKIRCSSCYYSEAVLTQNEEEISAEEQDFVYAERKGKFDWGVETRTVFCKTCGIEVIYDTLESVGECPYCGSNQIAETQTENTLAPNGVCMFKLDAKQAAEQFKNRIRKHWFCLKEMKETAKPEAFKGIYLPYWTFDTHSATTYEAEYGIHRQSKSLTVTDWYWCSGTGHEFVDDQKVSGSNRHEQDLLYGILPFHTEDNKVYRPEYLAGVAAERCSVGLKDAWESAKTFISGRLRRSITQKILAEQHADEVRALNIKTAYTDIKYKYLLVPVWVAHFNHKGKVYRFMVNGQTGSVSGKIPVSPVKVATAVAGAIAALGILWFIANL